MTKIRSFKNVIEARYFDELFNAVSEFVEENPDKLERSTHFVEEPEEAELSDLTIKSVRVGDSDGAEIVLDVIAIAQFEIAETVRRNRETDSAEQWFRVSCSAMLEDGLQDFRISDVDIYNQYDGTKNTLSDSLVPYIYPSQLDEIAEAFLDKYCPEALKAPTPVQPLEIARRMGLDVQTMRLTKNCTIFGQIYFHDCEIEYFDEGTRSYKPISVTRGTVLVDPEVFFMRNLGSVNNTIIHECVHWYKHRKVFELERLYNEDACQIRCQVVEGTRPEGKRTPAEWMEWQANALAPRILMPRKQAYIKANELVSIYMQIQDTERIADVIEPVIKEMAGFFRVSIMAAKIRMIDLGFEDAIGAYTHIDDRYVRPHSFAKGALKRNQTFSIGVQDALIEYATKPDLRKMLDSGKYMYVDSHFCINDPKYIQYNENGQPELTDYARYHADECCLVFDVEARPNSRYGTKVYTECVLYRDATSDKIIEAKYSHSAQNKTVEEHAAECHRISTEAKRTADLLRRLPVVFSETLVELMKWRKCTVELLAEKSLVSTKTIQRMRNNDDYTLKLGTVIAVCIGLQLPPIISDNLISKSGCSFKQTEEHITYQLLLASHYMSSIYECNEILEANGFKPIGREE